MAVVKPPDLQELEFASDTQQAAFEYGPYPTCAAGDFGSGKTRIYCRKLLYLADTFPRSRWAICRRQRVDLKATTMPTFFKECPPAAYLNGGRRNDADNVLVLNNQSEFLWLFLDNPDLASIIRGLEINGFLIDQAEEAPDRMEENFDLLCARLGRWELADVPQRVIDAAGGDWPYRHPVSGAPQPPPYALLTANRDVKTHWLYRRFHPDSIEWQTHYKHLGYKMFEMSAEENRFLSDVNKEQLRRQSKGSISIRQWGYPEGAIHQIPASSLIPGSQDVLDYITRNCTLHRFFTHGDAQPSCCLWAGVDSASNVFLYREYFQPNGRVSAHRQAMTDLSKGEHYELNIAHPKLFAAKDDGRPVSEEYADCCEYPRETALFWSPGDDNELGTRNRINEYLALDAKHKHPFTKAMGAPHLYFVTKADDYPSGCVQIIGQTEGQRRKKIGMDGGQARFSDDRLPSPADAYDCLRFLMASHAPKAMPVAQKVRPGSFEWHRQRLKQYRAGGRV